jgi:hypothetical protein
MVSSEKASTYRTNYQQISLQKFSKQENMLKIFICYTT